MVSLREFIAHLPPDERELLGAPARVIPARYLYGPVHSRTLREIRKARTTPWWARRTVTERLAETFRTAYRAPYYRENPGYRVLRDVLAGGLCPREGLSELPILTRQEVSAHYREMLATTARDVELSASSGTSGDPIFFLLDRHRGAREWAFVVDSWSATGYRLGQWRAYFRGLDLPDHRPYFVMHTLREIVFRIQTVAPDTVRAYWDVIRGRRIEYLHGYPSALLYFAKLLTAADCDTSWRHRIRGVMLVSEQVGRTEWQLLQRAFPNAVLTTFYGLSEKTAFARAGDDLVYHAYPLYGHVELLHPDGSPVLPGERGRVVTTSLDGRGMPLVRYDTGDSAQLVGYDAVGTPQFRDILARRGREGLVKADGELFATTPLNVHGQEFRCVHRFKIRQDMPGRAVLVVQPAPGAAEEDLERFRQLMVRRTENQVELGFELVAELPATVNGKHTLLDQRIPDAPAPWA